MKNYNLLRKVLKISHTEKNKKFDIYRVLNIGSSSMHLNKNVSKLVDLRILGTAVMT